MEEIEVWKDIEGWEELYQVSNMGQVKSLERTITYKDGRKRTFPERILNPTKNRGGYLSVAFWRDCKSKRFYVHQLVSLAFLENDNPTEKTQVNHLDENKENNHVDNLNWVTPKENINYGTRNERDSKSKKGKKISEETKQKIRIACKGKGIKPIIQLDLQNNYIRDWDSATDVRKELNIPNGDICNCCKGKQKSAYGYKWVYKSDYKPTYTQLELQFD